MKKYFWILPALFPKMQSAVHCRYFYSVLISPDNHNKGTVNGLEQIVGKDFSRVRLNINCFTLTLMGFHG
jgi:hypothetical protein